MSDAELAVALLALYHPQLVELHEQKMLHAYPAVHPLFGFPGHVDPQLKPIKGTLNVAARLNIRQYHPKVGIKDPKTGKSAPVAFPYQGDFLLFIQVASRIKLVNWSVKKRAENFEQIEVANELSSRRALDKLRRRHLIEEVYYQDIDVETKRVSQDKISRSLTANLRLLFGHLHRRHAITSTCRSAIVAAFTQAIGSEETATDVISYLKRDQICSIEAARDTFYQAIWLRELRIDLFKPIVLSAPLRPEKLDVFEHHADWFTDCLPSDCRQRVA